MSKINSNTSSHILIDGLFDGPDAQEVLLTLLGSKIDYHTRRCFSSKERFGVTDLDSERRIEELKATRVAIRVALAGAQGAESQVRIHSSVDISVESRAPQSV